MTSALFRAMSSHVIELTALGPLGEDLSGQNGECRRVCRVAGHAEWIFKEYLAPVPALEARRLNRLIELPGQMKPADQALVSAHTSWPLARVINAQQQTVGVLLPLAPDKFSTTWNFASGRSKRKPLDVDVLALNEADQVRRKLPPQRLADRISVCASIAAVGALFERWKLVYLDWSYANVFWSTDDHSAFVIDLDGCSFEPRLQIQSHSWDDPLVPRGTYAGNASDRYRLALLTARCLTGIRADLAATQARLSVMHAGSGMVGLAAGLLIQALKAQTQDERPSIARLSRALEGARKETIANASPSAPRPPTSPLEKGGVTGWNPVRKPGTTPGATTPPTSTGPSSTVPGPTVPIGSAVPPRSAEPSRRSTTSSPRTAANATPSVPNRTPSVPSAPPSGSAASTVMVVLILLVIVGVIIALTV